MRINLLHKPKIGFSLLLILLTISLSTISSALPDSTYSLSVRSGAQVFEVKSYNEALWKSTVNPMSDPSTLFGGEANISGAKSKLVSRDTGGNDLSTYGIFHQFFFRWFNVSYDSVLKPNGYDSGYINGRYPNNTFIWGCNFGHWKFTTNSFKNYANYTNWNPGPPRKHNLLLRHPSDFTRILLDYNDFATVVNNNASIKATNYTLPLLNGEDVLWQLIIYGLIIANPFSSYLNQIITALDCSNASVQGNTLIFRRSGEEFFNIEITFNDFGIMDTILMKNMQDEVFFHIVSSYPQVVVYVIFGVFCGAILGLVGIEIYLKSRHKKEIAKNLNLINIK